MVNFMCILLQLKTKKSYYQNGSRNYLATCIDPVFKGKNEWEGKLILKIKCQKTWICNRIESSLAEIQEVWYNESHCLKGIGRNDRYAYKDQRWARLSILGLCLKECRDTALSCSIQVHGPLEKCPGKFFLLSIGYFKSLSTLSSPDNEW